MLSKNFKQFINYKFLAIFVFAAFLLSGCDSYFGGRQVPSAKNQPQVAPQPVVIDGIRTSYADIVEKTAPAVVQITSEVKASARRQSGQFDFEDFFKNSPNAPQMPENQPQQRQRGFGSGVIISADGTILTNHHVVADAEKITVQMNDNKTYQAKIVGSDPPSDLAVLKIEATDLPHLNLGDSDNVRVGDIILAIGNPLGIGQSVTAGIVSAKSRRTGLSDGSFEDFLQIDAPINRGNSGGALVNLSGELIGINSQILSPSGGNIGIGFAIPSNMAKTVMYQLVKNGKVRRGMLGVTIQNITENIAKSLQLENTNGVLVGNVGEGSAAEKAGIKRGDIITKLNGEAIEDSNMLRNKVAATAPGTEIKVTIVRDGKQSEVKAVLGELETEGIKPDDSDSQKENKSPDKAEKNGKLGLSLQPLTPEIARELDIPVNTGGIVVTDVEPNGAAAEEGIRRGDIILEINRQQVNTLTDVQAAIEKSGNRPVLLLISRGGQTTYLTIMPQ